MSQYRVYGFDVFDTCLTRHFALPRDVFFYAARRAFQKNGHAWSQNDLHEAAKLRLDSEVRARKMLIGQDLTIDRVYACFSTPGQSGLRLRPEEFLRAEIEEELASVVPVPQIAKAISRLRRTGKRIIFITDMYLPAWLIQEMLQRFDLFKPGDGLYVSGEIGLTKHHGELFQYVLQAEGIKARHLWYIGDNPHADVRMARKAGVTAHPFSAGTLTPTEQAWVDLPGASPLASSRIAGLARLARLSCQDVDLDKFREVCAGIVAPVLTFFTSWVLRQAIQDKIKRLHFVSRDGQIMMRIAQVLMQQDERVELAYLHGSRQAWFLPSLCDRQNLPRELLFIPGHDACPRAILAKLNLCTQRMADAGQPLPFPLERQLQPSEQDEFLDWLHQPGLWNMIQGAAHSARELVLAYLHQQGLSSDGPQALVDAGWTLKTQEALRTLISQAGWNTELRGYYFGLSRGRIARERSGPWSAYYLERDLGKRGQGLDRVLFRNANLIEQVFTMADHGRVVGYRREATGRVEPVMVEDQRNSHQQRMATILHDVVLAFAEQYARYASGGLLHEPSAREERGMASQILFTFLNAPAPELALAFTGISVGDDQNESRKRPLVRTIGPRQLCDIVLGAIRKKYKPVYARTFDWLEGSLAISSPVLRHFFQKPGLFELLRKYRLSA